MSTIPSLDEIEYAIMTSDDFNFMRNLVVFRVVSGTVVNHECDCLVMTKKGYLSEIEIKRSYSDFLSDYKKSHTHRDPHIKYFYFMLHESFAEKSVNMMIEKKMLPNAVYVYDDECNIKPYINLRDLKLRLHPDYNFENEEEYSFSWKAKRLFLEEQYELARLGSMRYKTMLERIIKLNNEKKNESE